jgi:hypothetical protein
MKRTRPLNWKLVLLILPICGAIINFAVAWECTYQAYYIRRHGISMPGPCNIKQMSRYVDRPWFIGPLDNYSFCYQYLGAEDNSALYGFKGENVIDKYRQPSPGSHGPDMTPTYFAQVWTAGWPMYSLNWYGSGWVGTRRMPPIVYSDFVLINNCYYPIRPIWPGFAVNTMFYAVILWPVSLIPGVVRRTIRRKRGQCLSCAYPIGTSNVCAECGATLTITKA